MQTQAVKLHPTRSHKPLRHIITDPLNYQIQPEYINAQAHFYDAFGHSETETSANWVVRFIQSRHQSWQPFTEEDLNEYYQHIRKDNQAVFNFNLLIYEHYLIQQDEQLYVTHEFVAACFRSSPLSAGLTQY